MEKKNNPVMANALRTPAMNKMYGKRIVLASASPRRKEILHTFGLDPEIIPSSFQEDFDHGAYENVYEYAVATATEKAVEVYERLVLENEENGPDLVIGADTVVLSHVTPPADNISSGLLPDARPEILEKPASKADNLRMLLDLNGQACEVVTGVSIVYPVLTAPGYSIKSFEERTIVRFAESSVSVLEAYADSGEGIDRAGGFAAQGLGGMLLRKVDGDFWNVVGFPAASFFRFLDLMIEEDGDFLSI